MKFESAHSTERETAVELDSAKRQLEWQKKQFEALQAEISRAEAEWIDLTEAQAQIESEFRRGAGRNPHPEPGIVRHVAG